MHQILVIIREKNRGGGSSANAVRGIFGGVKSATLNKIDSLLNYCNTRKYNRLW